MCEMHERSWKMPEILLWNSNKTTGLSQFQGLYFFGDGTRSEINRGVFIDGGQDFAVSHAA
jgi:hypothetical protein